MFKLNKQNDICEISRIYGNLENQGRLKTQNLNHNDLCKEIYMKIYLEWADSNQENITDFAYNEILLKFGNETGGIKLKNAMVET